MSMLSYNKMTDSGISHFAARIGDESHNGLHSFTAPREEHIFQNFQTVPIKTLNAVNSFSGPYKFEVGSKACTDYNILKSFRLEMAVSIVRGDGSSLTAEDKGKLSVTNGFAHALFENIAVKINQVRVRE